MTIPELYALFVLLPGLAAAFTVITVVGLLTYIIIIFIASMCGDIKHDNFTYYYKAIVKPWLIGLLILCGIAATVLPSQKDMLLLVGGYAVTNNKELTKLPDNVLRAANTYLEAIQDKKDNNK
jgi:hypothetical protein